MWTVWGLLALRLIQKSRDNLLWGGVAARLTEFILGELSAQNKYLIRGLMWALEDFHQRKKSTAVVFPLSSYKFSVCRFDSFFSWTDAKRQRTVGCRGDHLPELLSSPCRQSTSAAADPVSMRKKTTKYAPVAQMCTCSTHFIKYAPAGTCVDLG